MPNKTLSQQQIKDLVKFDTNQKNRLTSQVQESFGKDETIQILNAVTDGNTVTEDDAWRIQYSKNRTGGLRFYVRPNTHKVFDLPCGVYDVQRTLERLSL